MKLTIYQVDAFASEVFKGNPAAVVPLEEWIDDALMQRIAMENNLSETAFFVINTSPPGPLSIRDVEGVAGARQLPTINPESNTNNLKSEAQAPLSARRGAGGEAASSSEKNITVHKTSLHLLQSSSLNPKELIKSAPATPSTAPLERGPGVRWLRSPSAGSPPITK